jgi:NTE family protein
MTKPPLRKTHRVEARPPFDCIALLLQGGGALGAYQAGVYEALAEAGLQPDWVAGISIGAINAALIAGNPPQERVAKLRQFWEEVSLVGGMGCGDSWFAPLLRGDATRTALNQISALQAATFGAPSFFAPRLPGPWFHPPGSQEATSLYDTSPLLTTLERLVDFDRLNNDGMRLSVGAVNVRSGNFSYFDTTTHKIGPHHVMASGALPPGFPAVEIEGEFYWDGGLVSNTPLSWVVNNELRQDTLAFQVDLWNARGTFPRDLAEVMMRQKEIQYSSRTRANTDQFKRMQRLRCALGSLLSQLPPALRESDEAKLLSTVASHKVYNIVHLIYRTAKYEGHSKDYEFSRQSMEDHWRAGYYDAVRTLRHPEVLQRPTNLESVRTFDLGSDARD